MLTLCPLMHLVLGCVEFLQPWHTSSPLFRNINSKMVFVGVGSLSHMRTVFPGLSDCMLGVSANIEISVCNMLLLPESSISNKLMNNAIQPNTNDWCLCHNICCLSGILQEACLFAL